MGWFTAGRVVLFSTAASGGVGLPVAATVLGASLAASFLLGKLLD